MSAFITALLMLTSLPLPVNADTSEKGLVASVLYFPLVGLLLALIIVAIYWCVSLFLPNFVSVAMVIIFSYLLTGGMHADGLIDTADGLFSGRPREKVLEIMRDSQVGAMGVIAFSCLLLLKFSLLISFSREILPLAVTIAMVCSRWSMAAAIVGYPYARKGEGLGAVFAGNVDRKSLILATFLTILILLILTKNYVYNSVFPAVIFILVAIGITFITSFYFYKKLGGLTGDTYGALNEILEITLLLAVLIFAHG